ncbi:hypothetical protein GKZ90_0018490 [Flavobacterium sp. MC2016-06]|jgi:hypothetical protein|uniref:hypothetical protein n=1 Tax=Flavobacterium sp. MC2016-06 TaxID=2676308 RepID=UPI00209B678C|nr:hypothetical protein [Flavobacterium sp. MC2016-06]
MKLFNLQQNYILFLIFIKSSIFYSQSLPIVGFGDVSNYRINTYDVPGSSGLDLHWYGGMRFGDVTSNSVMQITNGKVGIGNTNPAVKLDVIGTISSYEPLALGATVNSFQLINQRSGNVGENTIINRLWTYRDKTLNNWYSARIHDGISIDDSYKTPNVDTQTWWERDPLDNIQSWGNNAETYLTINKGNVGIGIKTPINKLDVNGTIHSKEVKVDMTGWSDFVFKKEYSLPTLTEVEKQINEKGHLENIPSEEEVLKNGINLGEMNSKLLQKIEELTLYMIDVNKKVKELQVSNAKLVENNEVLESKIKKLEIK